MTESFLTPKSSLTPLAAGSMVMVFTNILSQMFGYDPALIGLILSFLASGLAFKVIKINYKSIVCWVFNAFTIFSIAVGSSSLSNFAVKKELEVENSYGDISEDMGGGYYHNNNEDGGEYYTGDIDPWEYEYPEEGSYEDEMYEEENLSSGIVSGNEIGGVPMEENLNKEYLQSIFGKPWF